MTVRAAEARVLALDRAWKRRFIDLHTGVRTSPVTLPAEMGKGLALVSSDAHGEVGRFLDAIEALPVFSKHIDLGDKLDRGPDPIGANQMLHFSDPPVQRLVGNHDAMWVGAGLGIPRLAIELVRWLLRYNEDAFLTDQIGIDLAPLRAYAERRFGDLRGDYKSKSSKAMEAAATYLKIIAEAPYRFPELRAVQLDAADRRIRSALFHNADISLLSPGEKDIFDRLTADGKLEERDGGYFYRLMAGLREFNDEERSVIEYFTRSFQDSHAFFQLIEAMVGEGEIFTTLRMADGAPADMLFTHAGIPLNKDGGLAEYHGLRGRDAFVRLERDIQRSMAAWRLYIEAGERDLLVADQEVIDGLGDLAWGAESPIYMRVMQTAARAVLTEASGLWEEPKGAFYTHWIKAKDPQFVEHVCREIGGSFGLDPRRLVIVHGHEPSKDGNFKVGALGHDLNIDTGAAEKYGGFGAFLLIGTNALYQFDFREHGFRRIELTMS